jgi:tetrapyrrole methylase family protein/MazG family protein
MEAIAHQDERPLTSYSTPEWIALWARAKENNKEQ